MYTYKIYQDEKLVKEFNNQSSDSNVFGWLLRNQGQSVSWALKHGGWRVDVINEETNELTPY